MHDFFCYYYFYIQQMGGQTCNYIELFEVFDINSAIMAPKLQQLFDKFSFTHKILVYVKDEAFN